VDHKIFDSDYHHFYIDFCFFKIKEDFQGKLKFHNVWQVLACMSVLVRAPEELGRCCSYFAKEPTPQCLTQTFAILRMRQTLQQKKITMTSIANREKKLVDAAFEIATQLLIIGLTVIEDKLQKGVPETISKLAKAGIKL
jgi:magnesium-transporting ATPase (P-type)